MAVIEVKNLTKFFGKTKAVDDISFKVEKGEIFGFLGPNGAGKTTTIRCLLDFLKPQKGEIKIFGLDHHRASALVKKKIGYLPGAVRLYDSWTGKDHLEFVENLRDRKSVGRKLATMLDLNLNLKTRTLSSGNRQKLGLVLALSFQPELIIMDEPTLGLDPLLQNACYELLEEFQKRGTTIFMSSHNLTEVDRLCSRVGIIKDGKLAGVETIANLKAKKVHLVKAAFIDSFSKEDFLSENVEIKNQTADSLILAVRGDLNPLIKKLGNFNLRSLEINPASLEEIFLEFYEAPQRGAEVHRSVSDGAGMSSQSGIPKAEADGDQDLKEIPRLE
ncbi:MAG TPA: ABC transporter ATP-binding protein [Patescibacteria group bacterium]|nr:ABC transporter ATP-binding protein [Patescibacteria group bacterium]